MFFWVVPGGCVFTLITAGNLATAQLLVSLIEERSMMAADRSSTILGGQAKGSDPIMFLIYRKGNIVEISHEPLPPDWRSKVRKVGVGQGLRA